MPTFLTRSIRAAGILAVVALALFAHTVVAHASVAHASLTEPGETASTAWVFFQDKAPANLPAALRDLERTAHPKAVERRRLRRTAPGLFDVRDLPVTPSALDSVRATGATIRVTSRWLNAMSVTASAAQMTAIEALPCVARTQPVRVLTTVQSATASIGGSPETGMGFYGYAQDQIKQIGLDALHAAGFTGDGVIIGVLDTGFSQTHLAFTNPAHPTDIIAQHDFVNDDGDTSPEPGDLPTQHFHGTYILGTMGAYAPNALVGAAYDASFILAKVEDGAGEYLAEEDLFVAGLEYLESLGADVATSSVVIFNHYTQAELDGATSVMTIGFNTATDNGMHCFQGAGNDGHDADPATSHLVPPADAVRTITVGAVDVNGVIAGFSSDGPTADGRTKPEILTRGVDTLTVDPDVDNQLMAVNGTSLATPLAAAAAACLVQAHPEWSVDQMRSALMRSATGYVNGCGPDPEFVLGYGIIDANAAASILPSGDIDLDGDIDFEDLLVVLATWGPCASTCTADLDGNRSVDFADLLTVLADWSLCPGA